MLILPAIDIRHGNCVRLIQGREEQETIYSENPIQMALQWKAKGAQMLHIVDLDGAFEGKPVNLGLISQLREESQIPIEVGGGFRELAYIEQAFDMGIDRIILGTSAIKNVPLVQAAVKKYGMRVTVSIDVAGAFAAASGWKEVTSVPFPQLAKQMRDIGVQELLFTDTSRDGTLQGPDIAVVQRYLVAAEVPVIISGGVSSLEDLYSLKELEPVGLKGVVIGKALYDRKIDLEEALKIA